MMEPMGRQPAFRILHVCAGLSIVGLVGLGLTALLGFEEPDSAWLAISAIFVIAAPAAALVHLAVTRTLTREDKRVWMKELAGRRAPWALSQYLTCDDRRAAAETLSRRENTSKPT
jgi:hypothetical protein